MARPKIRFVANEKLIGFLIQGEKVESQQRKRGRLARLVAAHEATPPPELPARKHPLYGPILKLHVANDKIADLRSQIEGCVTSKLNTVRFEDDPDGPHKLIRLVVGSPPDPKWDVEIGAIAVLLRSVLDVAVTQLSRRIAGRPKKPQFPIFLWRTRKSGNGTYVKDRGGARMVAHLPPDEQAIIERAQPYHAGNLRWRHPLWLLHELSNVDKHNALTAASCSIGSTAFTFIPLRVPAGIMEMAPMELRAGVPFEDGAVLGRVGREVNVKPHHSFAIRFAKGCPGAGDEAIDALIGIEKQVRKIIAAFSRLHP
jgi:hypothetical protein